MTGMARQLKVYTLGNHGFINRDVGDALGVPSHIRQADVLAVAPTKAEALRVLAEHGFPGRSPRDSEFRQATGNTVDALRAAGMLDQPGVIVTPNFGNSADGVVVMQPGGSPHRVGRLARADGYGYAFVPELGSQR